MRGHTWSASTGLGAQKSSLHRGSLDSSSAKMTGTLVALIEFFAGGDAFLVLLLLRLFLWWFLWLFLWLFLFFRLQHSLKSRPPNM